MGDQELNINISDTSTEIMSSNSRFKLQSLPSNEFPFFEETGTDSTFTVKQNQLKSLLNKTQFSMAQQDVRYYLNGLLIELSPNKIVSVGTDGHRLAKSLISISPLQLSIVIDAFPDSAGNCPIDLISFSAKLA